MWYRAAGDQIRNSMIVVEFALADQPEGKGGFCFIPGSHKSAFPRPEALVWEITRLEAFKSLLRCLPNPRSVVANKPFQRFASPRISTLGNSSHGCVVEQELVRKSDILGLSTMRMIFSDGAP